MVVELQQVLVGVFLSGFLPIFLLYSARLPLLPQRLRAFLLLSIVDLHLVKALVELCLLSKLLVLLLEKLLDAVELFRIFLPLRRGQGA